MNTPRWVRRLRRIPATAWALGAMSLLCFGAVAALHQSQTTHGLAQLCWRAASALLTSSALLWATACTVQAIKFRRKEWR